jgi:HEAT repeat protein
MGKIGGTEAVTVLADLLKEENVDIVRTAIGALGNIDHPESMGHAISALYYPQRVIKLEAVRALGKKGGREAVYALKKLFASEKDELVLQ